MGIPTVLIVFSCICEGSGDHVLWALPMHPGVLKDLFKIPFAFQGGNWQSQRSWTILGAIWVERNVGCPLTPAWGRAVLPQGSRLLALEAGLPPQPIHSAHTQRGTAHEGHGAYRKPPSASLCRLAGGSLSHSTSMQADHIIFRIPKMGSL